MIKNVTKKDLIKLYIEQKLTIYQIGDKYKCSGSTISNWLKKFKIQTRESKYMIGNNTWKGLSIKERETRTKELSERMTRYNPLYNKDVQKKKSDAEKIRRGGATGRLTHREKRIILESVGKCEYPNCGISYPLTVHHKDLNRYNNKKNNVMVTCFNHHYILHYPNIKQGYNAKHKLK